MHGKGAVSGNTASVGGPFGMFVLTMSMRVVEYEVSVLLHH